MKNPTPPKRPNRRPPRRELSANERANLAARARYVGSEEHKSKAWWGGKVPRARQLPGGQIGRPGKQTTTICPLTSRTDQQRATQWVQAAIANGQYRFFEADKGFPKKIWHRADGRIWCGMCLNQGQGEYKGWPIDEQEWREVFG